MKKVLIINGSPRKNGYTKQMIDTFVENANAEIEIFDCSTAKFSPCIDCRYCEKNFKCVIEDDMKIVYEKMTDADILIFATPVYFYSVSAQIKKMIDRLQVYFFKYIKNVHSDIKQKDGYIFSVGGAKSYTDQFKGIEVVISGAMKNLNCELKDVFYVSGSDNITEENIKSVKLTIEKLAKKV